MTDITSLARWIILAGLTLVAVGGLLWLFGRAGLPLGQLPGDLQFQRGNVTCFVPIATMLLLSVLLSLAINLIARLLN